MDNLNTDSIREQLSKNTEEDLLTWGFRKWSLPNKHGQVLWLFPADFYDRIQDGTTVITINHNKELFVRGKTDNDTRFGVLSFGFYRIHNPVKIPVYDTQGDSVKDETGKHIQATLSLRAYGRILDGKEAEVIRDAKPVRNIGLYDGNDTVDIRRDIYLPVFEYYPNGTKEIIGVRHVAS